MAATADVEQSAIEVAKTIYGLSDPQASLLKGGYQNQVWRLSSRDAEDVVLRRCPPPDQQRFRRRLRSRADQEWEYRYQALVAEAGLPAPRPLPTLAGDGSFQDPAGAWWSLSTYLPGSRPPADQRQAMLNVMDLLAELHLLGQDIATELGPRPLVGEYFAIQDWLGDCDQLGGRSLENCLQSLASGDDASSFVAACRAHHDHIRFFLDELARAAADPELATCPRLPIHADYWTLNAAFDGDRVVALYDFDNSHQDLRVIDLAVVLSRSCQLATGGIDVDLARAMLTRYHRRCPLTEAEYRHLPVAMVAIECWYILPRLAIQLDNPQEDCSKRERGRVHSCLWYLAAQRCWQQIVNDVL